MDCVKIKVYFERALYIVNVTVEEDGSLNFEMSSTLEDSEFKINEFNKVLNKINEKTNNEQTKKNIKKYKEYVLNYVHNFFNEKPISTSKYFSEEVINEVSQYLDILSDEYIKNVLEYEEINRIQSNKEVVLNALELIKQDINPIYNITKTDLMLNNKETEKTFLSYSKNLNVLINSLISTINNISIKEGGSFSTEMFTYAFSIKESATVMETAYVVKNVISKISKNYATMLDNVYEIVNTSLNNEKQFTNTLNKINAILNTKIDENNYLDVLKELKSIVETYNNTEIHNLMGDIYKIYDYINLMQNLFESFLKSNYLNNPDIEDNDDIKKLKEVDYSILSEYKNSIDKDLSVINKAILNDLSKIIAFIKDIEILINNAEAKNLQTNGNSDLTIDDVKRILSLSNYNYIYKDVDILDKYGQTFDQTALSQLTGLKLLFNKYTYEIKKSNQRDFDRIYKHYKKFEGIFGKDFEKVMYGLFEKKNSIRTGYLISKYDLKNSSNNNTKPLLKAEDDFRKSGLNDDMESLWESLKENTNIGSVLKKLIDSGQLDNFLGLDKLLMITNISDELNTQEEAFSKEINTRNKLYQFILKFSSIHYENKTKNKLSDYLNINNSDNNNIYVLDYLNLIENNINLYYNKLASILDKDGERIFSDEYITTIKEHMQNNLNMLYNYFVTKYKEIDMLSLNDISLLDFSKILNSFMQVYDREDICGYINYLYKETEAYRNNKDINNKFNKSSFNKFYLFNVGFGLNPPKDISNKNYTKEYNDYLKLHSNKKALEELYDFVYNELLNIHHETGMINQYSMFDNKLFAFEAKKSDTEVLKENGINSIIRQEVYDIIHDTSNTLHKIYLENNDSILPYHMPNKLSLTEDMMSKNIFLNIINATILKNRHIKSNEIIADAKSHIIALKNYVSETGSSTKPLEKTINKIVSKAKFMLGEIKEDVFEKPVVELTETGEKKIVNKLGQGFSKELQFEHVLNELEKNFLQNITYKKYKGFQQIQNKFGAKQQNINPKKHNISMKEINDFFENLISIYEDLKKNNSSLAKYFEYDNKYLKHFVLHFINKNNLLQQSLSSHIGRKDLHNLNTIEFIKGFTEWFKKNVKLKTPFDKNDRSYNGIDVTNEDMVDFFTKSYIQINGVDVELETEETSFIFNGKTNQVKDINTNFTSLTIEDLEKFAINIFANISYTESTEVSKLIEMEKERTRSNYKVIHTDKVINRITTETAKTTLNLNAMTFVAEMSYGFFGLLGLGVSSNKYGLVDVMTSFASGLAKTTSSAVVKNNKLKALQNLLSRNDFVSSLPKDSNLYKHINKNNTLDNVLEKYKNFTEIVAHIPNTLYRNTILDLVASKFNVAINENGVKKIINILDCFDSNGNMIYEIDNIYLTRFIMTFDDVLKQISLYNNDYIEINKNAVTRAVTIFKTFIFNLTELYIGRDKYIVGDDLYRRGMALSLFGKGGLLLDSKKRISISHISKNLMAVLTNSKGDFKYQSDVGNIRKIGMQLFIILTLYLILSEIEVDLYEEKEYTTTDDEGNIIRGKRRRRRKERMKDLGVLYAVFARMYRENIFMYSPDSTLGFLAKFGLPQVSYLSNYFNLATDFYSQERYTTGIYKGKYKWEIDLMKLHYLTNSYLRLQNIGNNANKSY